jgi:hypothetical protein
MAKSKVNVKWQSLFAAIPLANLWAAYKIERLRKFLLIFIPVWIAVSLVVSVFVPFPYSLIPYYIIVIPIEIYFIRKWSIQWNQQFNHDNKTSMK